MDELHGHIRLDIHPGKLEEFKQVAAACMKSVREQDSGTLQYDWYLNADQTVCLVRETFRNSEAVLEHMGNLGILFGQLLSTCDLSGDVFGHPSPTLKLAMEGMEMTYYEPFPRD